ncbi:MAG: hypothetical protein ACOCNL_16120 [Acetivibrio ethanolgignens]
MRLSEFDKEFFNVVKDGIFDTLGNITSNPAQPYLSFATNETYISNICKNPQISCVICTPEIRDNEILNSSGKGIAVSVNPKYAFQYLHNELIKKKDARYVTNIKETKIGDGCLIHEKAFISSTGVVIGNNVVIEENVVIKEGVTIAFW